MSGRVTKNEEDTIAAIATATGRAALAVVRLSGPGAIDCADRCMHGLRLSGVSSHSAHVGMWHSPDGEPLDQVVATVFRAPRSATGEDVVEVSCHGGDYVAARILESMLECGARVAEPGEFTQRAFLNGKMDLAQAEAVADLIHASSARALRVSISHLQGRYSRTLDSLRQTLLDSCALAELEIDFADEDVEFAERSELGSLLDRSAALLAEALTSYGFGELIREGVRVVIAGRPNAGKSTLLNALLGQDRVIVSPEAGTTRDVVEAEKEVDGLLFRFTDTAGLRSAPGPVEAEGVERARKAMEKAVVILYVYDMSIGLDCEEESEIQALGYGAKVIAIGNKNDLEPECGPSRPPAQGAVRLSAKEGLGNPRALDTLWRLLLDTVGAEQSNTEGSRMVTNQRHEQHMRAALQHILAARRSVAEQRSADLFTLDMRAALYELGCITGAVSNEEVLGTIFSRFCIGK